MLIDLNPWRPLLETEGPLTWLYGDIRGPQADESDEQRLRWRAARRALADAGANDRDLDALEQAITEIPPRGESLSCYLAAAGGSLRYQEQFDGPPLVPPRTGHGPVADILPLVVHASGDVPYLLVEAGRDGGDVSLHGASRPTVSWEVQGEDLHLSKVRGGGWSHRRLHAHTEEVWRRNAADLVESVAALWAAGAPRVLVLSGDVRAREKVRRGLPDHLANAVVEVDRHTVPEGASRRAVDDALNDELHRLAAADEHDALAELATQMERSDAAVGLRSTVAALRSSRARVVLIDPWVDTEGLLVVLAQPPWVALPDEADAYPGEVLGQTAAHIGVLRAAALTGAAVLVVEPGHLPDDADIAALVRWPTS